MTRVAGMAVQAIPGADGAGLRLLEANRPDLIVKSTEFVRKIDDIQYGLWEGPWHQRRSHRADDTVRVFGWRPPLAQVRPSCRPVRRAPQRVVFAAALPGRCARCDERVRPRQGRFRRARRAARRGMFATPAAISVLNAQILAQSQRLARQLQAALTTRPIIDQAIGVLRSRSGATAAEAFERLRTISQTEHRKLNEVAANIVDEAAARARARHQPTN